MDAHITCIKYWTHFSSQNSAIHGLIPGNLFPGTTLWESIFLGTVEHSVQFSHSVVSDSLRPHELQHARPPCPSPTPRVYPNSCPLSQWCHSTISSSVSPFSSHPQSLPTSESFLHMRWPKYWTSASFLPKKSQGWSPLEWTGWISLQSKGL